MSTKDIADKAPYAPPGIEVFELHSPLNLLASVSVESSGFVELEEDLPI